MIAFLLRVATLPLTERLGWTVQGEVTPGGWRAALLLLALLVAVLVAMMELLRYLHP
ncbi:hypothetical protein [Roseomonas elaeocarpi]|uniref:Uncharacterized protein n=1 Tax=Roseomonas elaeocarpi TaxID=907779 RepID=A0ABV6JSG6_9PROT